MKLYKVLNKDLTSPFRNFKFELGKQYICKDFNNNPNNDCSNGFYATDLNGLIYSLRTFREVYLCEVSGKKVEIDKYKRRYEKFKLIKKINHNELKKILKENDIDNKEGFKYTEALFPINPLLIKRNSKVTKEEIELLKVWASVWASVRASIRDSVGDSVWDFVWASVRDTVWDTVWASVVASVWASVVASVWASVWDFVWASVRAYISSLFPNIVKWKYIEHESGINPFQSCIDLWKSGLVPSFDGTTWRLHTGKKGKVIYKLQKGETE